MLIYLKQFLMFDHFIGKEITTDTWLNLPLEMTEKKPLNILWLPIKPLVILLIKTYLLLTL